MNIYRIGRGGLVKIRPTNAQMQDVSVAKPLHENVHRMIWKIAIPPPFPQIIRMIKINFG